MKEITKIQTLPELKKRLRVGAYCRVSSDKDAMHDSLASQISHFNEVISKNPEWVFVAIYADEAISGTKNDRPEFVRMMEDCEAGKLDLILVKAVSRFARNALTVLECTRKLKKLGVDVFFESENLHSITTEGEMILTMTASFAQAEAKSVSDNMLWRIAKDFNDGKLWGAKDCYGYKIINKKMIVVPQQAEMIRKIYSWYIEGMGITLIAKQLNNEGFKTLNEGALFNRSQVRTILTNINYTGAVLLQKTYRASYMEKKKLENKGQRDMYLVENDHEAIIPKDTFELVQQLMAQRTKLIRGPKGKKYPFTGLLKCAKCGHSMIHKNYKYGGYYSCMTHQSLGKDYCASKKVPDKYLEKAAVEVLELLEFDEVVLRERVTVINADEHTLDFFFKDGSSKTVNWQYESRSKSWTPEMREMARQRTLNNQTNKNIKQGGKKDGNCN